MSRKSLFVLPVVFLLLLCSCFSKNAHVADFGSTLTTEYGQTADGAEYVEMNGDVAWNSVLVIAKITFTPVLDTIHVDVTLDLAEKGAGSMPFPWRIPLTERINRITFGPEREVIWQRTGNNQTSSAHSEKR